MNGWIGFDLDGTLAIYTTWKGVAHIGDPIPLMVERVKECLKNGYKVKIFTARVCSKHEPEEIELAKKTIAEWSLKHIGQALEATAEKDYNMIEYYDDRAYTVEFNTGKYFTPCMF